MAYRPARCAALLKPHFNHTPLARREMVQELIAIAAEAAYQLPKTLANRLRGR
jgi:hypothetical protein